MLSLDRLLTRGARSLASVVPAAAGSSGFAAQAEVTWYGQSAFVLKTPEGRVLLFHPWFANPMNPEGDKVAEALEHVDLIL